MTFIQLEPESASTSISDLDIGAAVRQLQLTVRVHEMLSLRLSNGGNLSPRLGLLTVIPGADAPVESGVLAISPDSSVDDLQRIAFTVRVTLPQSAFAFLLRRLESGVLPREVSLRVDAILDLEADPFAATWNVSEHKKCFVQETRFAFDLA